MAIFSDYLITLATRYSISLVVQRNANDKHPHSVIVKSPGPQVLPASFVARIEWLPTDRVLVIALLDDATPQVGDPLI